VADLLPEFLAGRVSAADEEMVRRHLDGCAGCRERANAVSLLQQTPVPVPDPDRWAGFVAGVMGAAAERRRSRVTRRAWLAVATLAVIALAVVLWATLGA
jgi:predicted anti-sigma-YlaC factor YlaD